MKSYAILFAVGVLTVQGVQELPDKQALWIGVLCIVVSGCYRYWRLMFYVAGFVWGCLFALQHQNCLLPESLVGQDLVLTGKVLGLPDSGKHRVRFDFAPDRELSVPGVPAKIRLSWYNPEQIVLPDQLWRLTVRLKVPHGFMNPGGFDYERWLFQKNIGATGYIRQYPEPVLLFEDTSLISIDRIRDRVAAKLKQLLRGSENLGIISALAIGDKQHILAQQWQILIKTGTLHLMAISGLHIGLVAGFCYFLVLKMWGSIGSMRFTAVSAASLAACLGGFSYAALAGFSMPTVRALIMLLIASLAVIGRRNLSVGQLLALCFGLFITIDPLAVLNPGFWLSFVAVGLIFYVLCGRLNTGPKWLVIIKINLTLALGLMPLLLYFFQQISLVSPLANLLAIPFVSILIVPLTLIACLMIPVHTGLAAWVLQLVDHGLTLLFTCLGWISEWPYAQLNAMQPGIVALILAMCAVLLVLMPKGMPGRWLALGLIIPLWARQPNSIPEGSMQLTVLDVGQGLAMLVRTRNHTMLYDTGMRLDEKMDMGRQVVLPYFYQQGLTKLDLLMISHGDNDHSGGAASVLDALPVLNILTGAPQLFAKHSQQTCREGQSWVWDQVRFELLAPPESQFTKENDNSCVLKITALNGSVLMPGDIETAAEQWLLEQHGEQLKATVLIAPHHGSKTSSGLDFLKQVDPEYILVSAGYKNRFHHPHHTISRRYDDLGINWLNTANQGALTLMFTDTGIQLNRYRNSSRHYWNRKALKKPVS